MSTSKSQRLVNLVICLLSRQDFQSAQRIRRTVQGYEDSASDEAFARTFERDKAELEAAGIVLEKGAPSESDEQVGYRILRDDVELPALDLTPRAAGVLAVVGEVWAGARRNAEITGALGKLRAAGLHPELAAPLSAEGVDLQEFAKAADLAEYAAGQRVVRFAHTAAGGAEPSERTIEPWLVASRAGHWYVVGFDCDREDSRSFRVSRISALRTVGKQKASHPRPTAERVRALLDDAVTAFDATIDARVWVATGAGAELRAAAGATEPGQSGSPDTEAGVGPSRALSAGRVAPTSPPKDAAGEVITFSGISLTRLARLVAGAGNQAIALEPAELVRAVIATLKAAQGSPQRPAEEVVQ